MPLLASRSLLVFSSVFRSRLLVARYHFHSAVRALPSLAPRLAPKWMLRCFYFVSPPLLLEMTYIGSVKNNAASTVIYPSSLLLNYRCVINCVPAWYPSGPSTCEITNIFAASVVPLDIVVFPIQRTLRLTTLHPGPFHVRFVL